MYTNVDNSVSTQWNIIQFKNKLAIDLEKERAM